MIRDAPPLCRSFPSLLVQLVCLQGKSVVRDKIAAALEHGSAWLDCYWYNQNPQAIAEVNRIARQCVVGLLLVQTRHQYPGVEAYIRAPSEA